MSGSIKERAVSITARPRKDTFDYFPHDTDAAHDEKIEAMRALYGNDGYAFYLSCWSASTGTTEFWTSKTPL